MDAISLLKKWLQYAEYNPDQKSFSLFSTNYELHKCCETISALLPYDPTGIFSIMYAKYTFVELLKQLRIKAIDCVSKPDYLHEEREMWEIFHSEEFLQMEASLLDTFDALVQKIVPAKMLGKRDKEKEKEAISEAIDAIARELPKCNKDLFLRGGEIRHTTNFSTSIHVFDQLAECLLALENAPDGMYLCYIRCGDTADGYFGFYLKSNGNILSINERVNEAYPGSHSNSRNGRWSENKKYTLFPYNFMFSFEKHDYKGYASQHIIDEEKLAFFNLEPDAYLPLLLAMLMLDTRYADTATTDMPLKYVDSLLPVNLALPTPGTTALTVRSDSALAAVHKELPTTVTTENILDPGYSDRFLYPTDPATPKPDWGETGSFRRSTEEAKSDCFYDSFNDAPLFIRLYGQGFEIQGDELFQSNSHIKCLASEELAALDPKKIHVNAEYVGTPKRMELAAYRAGRIKLAEHIRREMKKEFIAFGEKKAVERWYLNALHAVQDRIFTYCADACRDFLDKKKREHREHLNIAFCEDGSNHPRGNRSTVEFRYDVFCERHRTPAGCWNGDLKCVFTGAKSTYYATFRVESYLGIAELLGVAPNELPKIIQGYRKNGHTEYGNSILSATDAVTGVGTPMERREAERKFWIHKQKCSRVWNEQKREWEFPDIPDDALQEYPETNFNFVIGFSKRGMKKLLQEHSRPAAESGESDET